MKKNAIVAKPKLLFICLLVLTLLPISAYAAPVDLGTAASFGVLAGSGVTNAVAGTVINGNVGSFPTPSISGLLPADVNGILYAAAGAVVGQAKLDLGDAYTAAAGATGGVPGPAELGGATLLPGVYTYSTAASWTFGAGNLTLDANGDASARWIFQIGTTLITPANANVLLIRGASANNVFWQVGSSATLGATNSFAGNILAHTDITLGGGTLNGRALASDGAVTISGAVEDINVPGFVPSEANVPDVIDHNQADANTAITGAGLIVGTITNAYSNTVTEGNVISQNPVGGTAVAGGSDVNFVISLGRPVVPDVVGQTQADADSAITGVSLIVGTVTNGYNNTVAAGLVISQNPAGNTVVDVGSDVNLVISLGRPVVPNVVGQTQEDAIAAITAVELTVGTVTQEHSDTVGAGLVISQSPTSGTVVNIGSAVNMVVSLGHAVLVYRVSTAMNPEIDYNDANGIEADVDRDKLYAYVVLDVNTNYAMQIDVNDANGNPDANNNPTAILFGKDGRDKFKITLGGSKPDTFVNISTFGDVNSIRPFDVTSKRNAIATSVGIGFGDSNATTGFDIGTSLYGKNTTINIGLAGKFSVAKNLKGQIWLSSQGRSVEGWGAARATLDLRLTRDANKNNRTVAATVANIQTTVLHHYATRTVLPLP